MINQENIEKIKQAVNEFFQKTSFEVGIEVLRPEDKTVPVKIKTEDPKILIGQNGQTLAEIQHILKAILRRRIDQPFYIELDINNYKEKKIEYLKETARFLADEVSLNKQEKELVPMPAYERRIVHLELQNREDITTQSIGEGMERRLIIKPSII